MRIAIAPIEQSNTKRSASRSSRHERTPSSKRNIPLSKSVKKFKKLKKRKTKQHNPSEVINEDVNQESVLYQMLSESGKKVLRNRLDEYKLINEQLAKENEDLKQRLSQYEGDALHHIVHVNQESL